MSDAPGNIDNDTLSPATDGAPAPAQGQPGNPYDTIISTGKFAPKFDQAPGGGATPSESTNPYDDIIDADHDANVNTATGNTIAANGTNPDQAAQAAALSKKNGVPASVVQDNLDHYKFLDTLQQNQQMFKSNPMLADYMADHPMAARMAQDDFANLDMLTKTWRALATGFSGSIAQNQLGRDYFDQMLAKDAGMTPKLGLQVDEGVQQDTIDAAPQLHGFYGALQGGTGFVTSLLDNAIHGLPEAGAGAATGFVTGSEGGAAAGAAVAAPTGEAAAPATVPVGAGIGAVGGTLVGAGIGESVGFKADAAKVAAGQAYHQLSQVQGSNGEPISETARQIGAAFVGLGTYAVFGVGEAAETDALHQAASSVMTDAVEKAVARPTVQNALTKFGLNLAKQGAIGGGLFTAQEAVNIAGQELAKQISPGEFKDAINDPATRAAYVDQLGDAFANGFMAMGLTHTLGGAFGLAGDLRRAGQAKADMQTFQQLQDGAAASKLRARSPDTFNDFLNKQADGSPIENIFIPAERVQELYQSMGVDPTQGSDPIFGFVKDMPEQLEQAKATGGDVVIPTADYLTHIAGTDLSQQLMPDIRVRQDGMTLREAAETEGARQQILKENGEQIKGEVAAQSEAYKPVQKVYDDMYGQIRDAGYTDATARQYASLVAARYSVRGERLGADPHELYKNENITVQRSLPREGAEEGYNTPDEQHLAMMKESAASGQYEPESLEPPPVQKMAKPAKPKDLKSFLAEKGIKPETTNISDLRSIGADKARVGIKQIVRKGGMSLDSIREAAAERGYGHEYNGLETPSDMLDAIRDTLHGKDIYSDQDHDLVEANRAYQANEIERGKSPEQRKQEYLESLAQQHGVNPDGLEPHELERAIHEARAQEFNQPAFHGSPHIFDKFSSDKIGTGEGAQAFGHGLYFAGNKEVAKYYRDSLTNNHPHNLLDKDGKEIELKDRIDRGASVVLRTNGGDYEKAIAEAQHYLKIAEADHDEFKSGITEEQVQQGKDEIAKLHEWRDAGVTTEKMDKKGRLYHVELAPEDHEYLDWDKGLKEQSPQVQEALAKIYHGANPNDDDYDPDEPGGDIYTRISHIVGENSRSPDPVAASKALADAGIPGIKYLDQGSRGAGIGHHNYVIFDDRHVSIQSYEQENRGKITMGVDRDTGEAKAIISLFKKADLSTALHEFGHLWLDEMIRDSEMEGAPDQIKDDMQSILKYMGVEHTGQISVEQHELFARGFERYLLEGKAPSQALASAFSRFRAWLANIYRSVRDLNAPISNELRGVFDRMLATDDEIEEARNSMGLNPVFKDAESAGMTQAEFRAYTRKIQEAQQTASDKLMAKVMATITRQRTQEWKDQYSNLRENVSSSIRGRDDIQAQHMLRTGKMLDDPEGKTIGNFRVSRETMVDRYGQDIEQKLPKGMLKNGGMDPDDAAQVAGYSSGDDLVKAMMSLEHDRATAEAQTGEKMGMAKYINYLIDTETERQMNERHGDILNDGSIQDEAMAAVHSQQQAEVMSIELKALARQAGVDAPFSGDDLRKWVQDQVSDMGVKDAANPSKYARIEAKAGRDTERALLKGDIHGAFIAKQRQLVNHLFGIEANGVQEEYTKGQKLFTQLASKKTVKAIAQDYLDQVHVLLTKVGFSTARDPGELQRAVGNTTLAKFIQEKMENEGLVFRVPDFLTGDVRPPNIKDMSVDEYRALRDAVQSIAHNGRKQQEIISAGKKVAFGDFKNDLISQRREGEKIHYETLFDRRRDDMVGKFKKIGRVVGSADAALTKPERIVQAIDNEDKLGAMHSAWLRPLKDAEDKESLMRADEKAAWDKFNEGQPDDWSKTLDQKLSTPELIDQRTGQPHVIDKSQLLTIMMNWGNDSNRQKLLDGEGWTREQVQAVADRYMTKPDWDFVQHVIDRFENLFPQTDELYRRLSGVGLKKIDAVPIETKFGTYKGGYFPLLKDMLRAKDHGTTSDASLMGEAGSAMLSDSGRTKERTGATYPLDNNIDRIPRELYKAIHDISYREALINGNKILSSATVAKELQERLGPDAITQLRSSLKYVARAGTDQDRAMDGCSLFLRQARMNVAAVGVLFRLSTVMKHGVTALLKSVSTQGADTMSAGFAEYMRNPIAAKKMVYDASPFMRFRMDSIDRDVVHALADIKGKAGIVSDVQRFGHYFIGISDQATAIPTWIGALRKAEAMGLNDADCKFMADAAVRDAHGASGAVDLAAIQRGNEFQKLLTTFYSFMSNGYNIGKTIAATGKYGVEKAKAGDYAGARRDFAKVLAQTVGVFVLPGMYATLISHGGPDDKKKESWGSWAAKAAVGEAAGTVPVLRNLIDYALYGHDIQLNPLGHALQTVYDTGADAIHASLGDHSQVSQKWLQKSLDTVGYCTGLPVGGQISTSAQYLWDINQGRTNPKSFNDFLHGIVYGTPKKGTRK